MRILHKVEDYLLLLLAAALFLDVMSQIASRYLPITLSMTEELGRYLFIWMVCLGISRAVRTDEHIKVTFFLSWLPERHRYYVSLLADLLFLGFSLVFVYYGASTSYFHFKTHRMAVTLGVPVWIFTVCVPFSFAMASANIIEVFIGKIHSKPRG